jgi:ribosome biogenesis protein MAK21
MKAVIINEIINLVLRPPAAAASSSTATTVAAPTSKHIRFDDAGEVAKPIPKDKQQQKNTKREGNPHARYYAAITFNQIVLTSHDRDVARKLLDVYFEMFKEILGEPDSEELGDGDEPQVGGGGEAADQDKDSNGRIKTKGGKGKGKGKMTVKEIKGDAGFTEVENAQSRLVSALLTGVNRALPFAKMDATNAGYDRTYAFLKNYLFD